MNRARSIVVGIDFSPCAFSALRQALRIARWNQAQLHVLHVISSEVAAELEDVLGRKMDDLQPGLIEDARREWSRFVEEVPEAQDLEPRVEIGHPISTLLERVVELSGDLLVLGVNGSSQSDRGAGTVATACVRKTKAPVLLVHVGHGDAYQSVVTCIDFSETSRKALEQGVRIAAQDGAKLHLLHVFSAPWHRLHYMAPTPQATPEFQRQFSDGLRGRLESFCMPLATELGFLHPEFHVLDYADHGDGITDFVQKNHVDLVVLGTRGRTNLKHLFWGRTAERVVRDAPCSILAVKPDVAAGEGGA